MLIFCQENLRQLLAQWASSHKPNKGQKPSQNPNTCILVAHDYKNWSVNGQTQCTQDSTGKFVYLIGGCGFEKPECGGKGASPPATLAEFTLDGVGGLDFFNVSLVDGYNVPTMVVPQGGSAQKQHALGLSFSFLLPFLHSSFHFHKQHQVLEEKLIGEDNNGSHGVPMTMTEREGKSEVTPMINHHRTSSSSSILTTIKTHHHSSTSSIGERMVTKALTITIDHLDFHSPFICLHHSKIVALTASEAHLHRHYQSMVSFFLLFIPVALVYRNPIKMNEEYE
ncbi:hypothetical protein K1719_017153 [Acacia pycnantha]|nr:hypothetical protein K1719_017153 [Acacia pycnantha]